MSGEKQGLVSAIEIALEEQDELVDQANRESARDLFGFEQVESRGPGRPAGARNRATEEQRRLILATGQSPLAYLASIWRDENRLTKDRVAAAVAALPYVHRKQPVAIDLKSERAVYLTIGGLDGEAELGFEDDGSVTIEGEIVKVESDGKSEA